MLCDNDMQWKPEVKQSSRCYRVFPTMQWVWSELSHHNRSSRLLYKKLKTLSLCIVFSFNGHSTTTYGSAQPQLSQFSPLWNPVPWHPIQIYFINIYSQMNVSKLTCKQMKVQKEWQIITFVTKVPTITLTHLPYVGQQNRAASTWLSNRLDFLIITLH